MGGDIGEFLAKAGLGRDAGVPLLPSVAEGLDQGCGADLSLGETPFRWAAADLGLDGVELAEPEQALGGELGAAAFVDPSGRGLHGASGQVCKPGGGLLLGVTELILDYRQPFAQR